MPRIDLSRYTVEFVRNFGFGYKIYTWFVSRKNYDRNGFYNSDTVWVFTTDDRDIFNLLRCSDISKESLIKFIKSQTTTAMFNDPVL